MKIDIQTIHKIMDNRISSLKEDMLLSASLYVKTNMPEHKESYLRNEFTINIIDSIQSEIVNQ